MTCTCDSEHIGRLAFRVEGGHWVAYCARPDTMYGAIWLGAIAVKSVIDNPLRRQVFRDLMKSVGEECLGDIIGTPVQFLDPEHERSGA